MMTNLQIGDTVKLVLCMLGTLQVVQNRVTDEAGRIELLIEGKWYYADTGNAVNGSLAYIMEVAN